MSATKEDFFKPVKTLANDKASVTDRAAREIIANESSRYQSKTERLRKLRLEQEHVEDVSTAEPKKRAKRKTAKQTD